MSVDTVLFFKPIHIYNNLFIHVSHIRARNKIRIDSVDFELRAARSVYIFFYLLRFYVRSVNLIRTLSLSLSLNFSCRVSLSLSIYLTFNDLKIKSLIPQCFGFSMISCNENEQKKN